MGGAVSKKRYWVILKYSNMEDEAPLTQKRGETTLLTVESAPTSIQTKRSMTFGTNSIDVSDIAGFSIPL